MTIGSLGGEFALIERIAADARRRAAAGATLRVGIGDDAAVLECPTGTHLLVTTDLLLEDVHFRRSYGDPFSLGVKAAAVNLSDIAAMGGQPTATFLSLGLPRDLPVSYVDEFYRGIGETLSRHGAFLAGGDTNVSDGRIVVNVTQLGNAPYGAAALRSGARVGDVVLVTGAVGAAAGGLALLEALGREAAESIAPDAVQAQLRPTPRVAEGIAAVARGGVTAMMDLSDGLVGDLEKLCRASGVGALIDTTLLPVAPSASAAARRMGLDPLTLALRGGEDYELLLTCRAEDTEGIRAAIIACGTAATVVGIVTDGPGIVYRDATGAEFAPPASWDHFAA